MPDRSNETLLTALGFPRAEARLYARLSPFDGAKAVDVAAEFDLDLDGFLARIDALITHEVVAIRGGRVVVRPLGRVVSGLLTSATRQVEVANQRVASLASALPLLVVPDSSGAQLDELGEPIDGEVISAPEWIEHIRRLARESVGDVMWLRPDQRRVEWETEMSAIISEVVADGRRVRVIYPVRVLLETPDLAQRRRGLGEDVRFVPELPTRMLVFGNSHAIVPEPLGAASNPRIVVRQNALVELAGLVFEQIWATASPLEARAGAGFDDVRRLLLAELASGAQDEQIARRLGLSLRTVRRRVAELLEELGAHSRFQAGVEAARRGWL